MRTTIDLPESLLREAKAIASESRRSLSEVVTDALRVGFARLKAPRPPVDLPVWEPPPGATDTWLKPGFDLDHMADFWEKLEEAEREEAERERRDAKS